MICCEVAVAQPNSEDSFGSVTLGGIEDYEYFRKRAPGQRPTALCCMKPQPCNFDSGIAAHKDV